MSKINVNKILDVSIALAREKDHDKLLEDILLTAMELTMCDAGTLYLLKNNKLEFKVMITKSKGVFLGGKREPIHLPPVELNRKNVCACAAIDRELINVADVYFDQRYDFSGPQRYDSLTEYKTTSMLVVPMENDTGEVIGVVQLINAKDEDGNIIHFREEFNRVLFALGCQAAIALTNMNYKDNIIYLLDSFVRAMSTAIDERSPYNANHTKNMVRYGENFIQWLNHSNQEWHFSLHEAHQFLMAVWLHDVGKLVIPLEVMDKNSRLGDRIYDVKKRLKVVELLNKVSFLEGTVTEEEYQEKELQVKEVMELVLKVNKPGFMPDSDRERIKQLGELTYTDTDGKVRNWFIPEEMEALLVQKGTLTPKEREIMESHVTRTRKILGEMTFSKHYEKVPLWAASHHEFLDGSGYPDKLTAEQIPKEVRLLTILDIFEALTANDRPYRSAMPLERAFAILDSMAEEGKLDKEILNLFKQSNAWKED